MKKIALIVPLVLLLSLPSVGKKIMPIYLSNYTFDDKSDIVGKIKLSSIVSSKVESIKVVGRNRGHPQQNLTTTYKKETSLKVRHIKEN